MPTHSAGRRRLFACLALLLCASGCAGLNDPFQREGTWRPENVNDANLAAMVADPRHLEHGVNDDRSPAVLSANAVRRLLSDHVKPLASTGIGPVAATVDTATSSSAATGATP